MRHVGGDPDVGEQVGEPTPAERGLERDLDRCRLELAEDPEKIDRTRVDPFG
jgi:hypothetical protein